MKVIDLLNKIANGEEVPKKIGYDNKIFEFDELEKQYTFHNLDYSVNDDLGLSIDGLKYMSLNDEVEIIEEDKKIEKIKWNEKSSYNQEVDTKKLQKILLSRTEQLKQGINEIIEVINKCG